MKLTRGSGAAGFDNCTGFTPDTTDYLGAGQGVLYDGKLSSYPGSYGSGLVDPAASGASPYSATVRGTAGLRSYWRLGDAASAPADDSAGTNDGTYVNGVTQGASGALAGDADTAAQFDGIDDYVRVAREIQDDFSIEFWFKSTQGLYTNDNWWGNAGLVDAEVAGPANDFGVTLRSDGKITAGAGTPDVTVVSSGAYNDGGWHHVVFTRTRSSGELSLYVDGAGAGTATGPTGSQTSPAYIDFGRLQAGWNYFAGSLDEVAVYGTALTSADVAAHYAARLAPEVWTTSESHDYKFKITLDNDSAALGKSATATFRWEARNR